MVDAQPPEPAGEACPYSSGTVMACRSYEPMSAHGDHPNAAMCRFAAVLWITPYVRRIRCHRADDLSP